MPTRLALVRHGETDWNAVGRYQGREDIPLNAKGATQARSIGQLIADRSWAAVVSSPLSRARSTAEIIAEILGLAPVRVEPDLIERDYGAASGTIIAERERRFPDGIPGLEDREMLTARGRRVVESLAKEFRGEGIIVVSHGGLINALLAWASRGELGTGQTRLNNGGLSEMVFEDDRWRVLAVNQVPPVVREST